ncbi:hypothetical protein [Roseomonas sp. CECT 9278]|uniref:hypothetical protein n=1 Tax=Roseomonas sp. CECT 9278 TaxID=2845823 RepID=UPI001E339AAA|nr:hypothetical protein [Roseomonas sp. CECT 9278]CAH0174647.1 hypothetical protein ROS9278_01285 [Roseomonas sp. CECT 9278]
MARPTRRIALALPLLALPGAAAAQAPAMRLFRVVSQRDDIIIGLTPAELAAMGTGPDAERIGRTLASQGQLGAWRYVVGRAPDGSTRYATTARVSILRQETYRIEPYAPALPVAPPPG